MRLLKMTLDNFQGIEHFEFELNGKSVRVNGGNGTGKTTLANAFFWLWFDQPFAAEKNYLPKSIESNGEDVTVEAGVEQDGKKMVLKKVLKEKRNSKGEFAGHTSECYVGDVPCETMKAFQKVLDGICPKDIALQLARFDYFLSETPMKERRDTVLKICGGIDDAVVFASEKRIGKLPDILKGVTTDGYISLAKDSIKKLKNEFKAISAVIAETQKNKPEISGTPDELSKEKADLEAKKAELEQQKASCESSATGELKRQIAELETEKERAKNAYISKNIEKSKPIYDEINGIKEQVAFLKAEKATAESNFNEHKKHLEKLAEKRNIMLSEWSKVNDWRYNPDAKCPTCGQAITESMFNVRKSNELEKISVSGKAECSAEIIEEEKQGIVKIEQKLHDISAEVEKLEAKASELQGTISEGKFEETEEYQRIENLISNLKGKMSDSSSGIGDLIQGIASEISSINQKLEDVQRMLILFETAKKADERIIELYEKQKTIQKDIENYEYGKYLCELFQSQKARLLEDKVNSKFKNIKFRLFNEQVNVVKDDCEALVLNDAGAYVPFKSTNTAARVNAGLEMVEILSDYYGQEFPCFLDGCESVEEMRETEFQQIQLCVTRGLRELEVETC